MPEALDLMHLSGGSAPQYALLRSWDDKQQKHHDDDVGSQKDRQLIVLQRSDREG